MEDEILIDNYLKGLLSKDEHTSFLERLKSDVGFKDKFKLEEQLFNSLNEDNWSFVEHISAEVNEYKKELEGGDLQNLKNTLKHANSEFNNEKQKKTKPRRLYYYIAAASIIVFLGFQFFFNQNVSNQDLYNDYIELNNLPSFVSRNDSMSELDKAQNLFEEKKYNDALSIFESFEGQVENEGILLLYKGITQTELNKYDEAEDTFNSIIISNLIDAEKGYWYKALLYLKQDKVKKVKSTLNEIISNSLYNHSKAKELLSKIENE